MLQAILQHNLKEHMKIVLTLEEVKEIVLGRINKKFESDFNAVSFDGYAVFKTATIEFTEPEVPIKGDSLVSIATKRVVSVPPVEVTE